MQNKDDTAAATKLDVKMLMETLGDMSVSIEQIQKNAEDVSLSIEQIQKSAEDMEQRMLLGFELIRADILDAKKGIT